MKAEFTKQGTLLIAESREARDILVRIKNGQYVIADIRVPRSIRQHRLYWGMLNMVYEAQTEQVFGKVSHLHNAIKYALGYTETLYDTSGNKIGLIPDKTDFTSMDRLAFSELLDKAIRLIITDILPRINRVDFEKQFYDMLGERSSSL